MGPAKRILVFGPTGVQKDHALANLQHWLITNKYQTRRLRIIDFDSEYIRPDAENYSRYLDRNDEQDQRADWRKAWDRLIRDTHEEPEDIILALHGTVTRPFYGVRAPVSISAIREFNPTHIVTLIDDVYGMRFHTHNRAADHPHVGDLTLEQLVAARRAEILVADIVASHIDRPIRNFVLAVRHPARTLAHLLFSPEAPKRVYLSFPISQPRRMLAHGDSTGRDAVNEFLRQAYALERQNPNSVCFCPLTIDELPLLDALTDELVAKLRRDDEYDLTVSFRLGARWNVSDFLGTDELLTNDSLPETIELSARELFEVFGLINADVRIRDYRLTRQVSSVAVFSPVMAPGKIARGVDAEIASARDQRIEVNIFQDPRFDPGGLAVARYRSTGGTMGDVPTGPYVVVRDSLQGMLEHAIL